MQVTFLKRKLIVKTNAVGRWGVGGISTTVNTYHTLTELPVPSLKIKNM
jgi:hypothetical protein